MRTIFTAVWLSALLFQDVFAVISIDPTNADSIKQAAATAAAGMVQYYTGNRPGDTPGNLPDPYYWWEAGAMFGALIDYWYFTGDDQYNGITMQAMLHQAGPDRAFMPLNQTKTLGNDDQAFWGMAAMTAAENKFPNPPEDQPQWLALAQAVFNTQVPRWNTDSCGGGLKWQIYMFNNGYNYKNTISNGCFFNIASRLATYTGDAMYAEWAVKMWDWSSFETGVALFDENYNFYDGKDDLLNCTAWDRNQWSYNAGVFLVGAANMYNFTEGSPVWEQRLRGIIGRLDIFFKDGILWEAICEVGAYCNIDQRSFKAYLARWMAATIHRAPFTRPLLKPLLESSARGAAAACNGGNDGNQCNTYWTKEEQQNHGFQTGVGEQMSALEVFQANMVDWVAGPVTAKTGGISKGNVDAGKKVPVRPEDFLQDPITTADRAGAGILTVLVIVLVVGTAIWLMTSDE